MSEKQERYNQVFSIGTVLARVLDSLHWAFVTRHARGDTATETSPTVSNLADTVIAARPGRLMLEVQVQGVASSVRVACALTTSGGTLGEILDLAPGANRGGGRWVSTRWAGPVAIRATDAPVVVHVRETY